MPHTYSNLLYHLVFSTKDRIPFISKDIRQDMHAYIGGTIAGIGGIPLEVGGIDDHLHSLVRLRPRTSVADFLMELKPSITEWAKDNIDERFEWQRGYGAFSVSERDVESVRRYIQNQELHHSKMTFDDEFRMMLRIARIDFDERYLWK